MGANMLCMCVGGYPYIFCSSINLWFCVWDGEALWSIVCKNEAQLAKQTHWKYIKSPRPPALTVTFRALLACFREQMPGEAERQSPFLSRPQGAWIRRHLVHRWISESSQTAYFILQSLPVAQHGVWHNAQGACCRRIYFVIFVSHCWKSDVFTIQKFV